MSLYATVQGYITFKTEEEFKEAVDTLRHGGWVKEDSFVDECDNPINPGQRNIIKEELSIHIPLALYKNLTYLFIHDIFINVTGTIVWSSTDGCFQAGTIINGKERIYNLDEWCENNLTTDVVKLNDDNIEEYNEFTDMVEQEFHSYPH